MVGVQRRAFTKGCFACIVAVSLATSATALMAQTDPWPAQPTRIIVPFAADGATDVRARAP